MISPKVTSSTIGSALGVVLGWLLTQIPGIDDAPAEVHAALVVLVVAVLTFGLGYLKRDPNRPA